MNNNNTLSRKISNIDHHHPSQAVRRRKKSIFYHNSHQGGACTPSKNRTTINDNNDFVESKSRRRSTYFKSGNTAHNEHNICAVLSESSHYNSDGIDQTDYKEHYRRTILQMYAEDELAKQDNSSFHLSTPSSSDYTTATITTNNNQSCVEANQMYMFIKYMATEHESLLQILIFLPLILTSFYIAFVEKKPLVT